jgi:plasmid stabilization system protein ParE
MARAEWTVTAEDELTEIAYWIAVYRHREYGIDVLRVVDASRDFPRLFP